MKAGVRNLVRVGGSAVRRRAPELVLGAAAALAVLLIVVDVDLLGRADVRRDQPLLRLEFGELAATLIVVGLFGFGVDLLRRQRRELALRLEAETTARRALELALLDPLTGLANRRHFEDIFRAAAEKGVATRHALFLIDVDHFKAINDGFGHPTGDEVLKIIARRLGGAVAAGDLVCRLGGDEMAVVAFDVGGRRHAEAVRERLREAVMAPMPIATRTITATISIGTVLFPEDGLTAAQIYAAADEDLYRAKAARPAR